MDEALKRTIDVYIPHPRDETLLFGEYYCRDKSGRVHKVYVSDIMPQNDGSMRYGLRYSSNGKKFDDGFGWGSTPKGHMYDNIEDCKDYTHDHIFYWESIREKQEAEDG